MAKVFELDSGLAGIEKFGPHSYEVRMPIKHKDVESALAEALFKLADLLGVENGEKDIRPL